MERAPAIGDDGGADRHADGTEGAANGHQTPLKRTKMETSSAADADAMEGVDGQVEVKQEAPNGPDAADANGRAESLETGAGKPADVAAFWAQLGGDSGEKTTAADVKSANGDAAGTAGMDMQPPRESDAFEASQTAAVTTDGAADAEGNDANGDAAMADEQAATADDAAGEAVEEEEEVLVCRLSMLPACMSRKGRKEGPRGRCITVPGLPIVSGHF